jgi:hypothetical protein
MPSITPQIVNGVFEPLQPTTGALLAGTNPDTASATCSGTLIGCETFLTAAHCVESPSTPSSYSVFFQHAGFFDVTEIDVRSDYAFPVADVAVLKLAAPVSGIAPTPINTTQSPPAGTSGVIVGFGTSGGSADDGGLKRSGAVTTATCTGGISNSTSVCWKFESPIGPVGEDSNTCFGDSGGPLFVDFGAGPVVAGVTSGGDNSSCLPLDQSFDTNVFFYRDWVQSQGGADLDNTTCGSLAQVGTPGTLVMSANGSLSPSVPEATHPFLIPPGTELLRVAMNAEDDFGDDFDLFVKAGSPPTTSDFDCARTGFGQLGLCEFSSPTAGEWHVLVNRASGAGAYQVTVTAFGSECGEGNEGQPCSDGDSCTGGDTCQSGSCVGTPVTDGSSCDDGSLCTLGDTCQAGICTPGNAPAQSCRTPTLSGTSRLLIVDKSLDQNDRLVWRWRRGEATSRADFGTPTGATDYALCVYDFVGGSPSLLSETVIPGGLNWQAFPNRYRYADRNKAQAGVRRLVLKEGLDGKARIVLRAVGVNAQLPTLPLVQAPHMLVQLVNESLCWEAEYSTSIRNDVERFKALSD